MTALPVEAAQLPKTYPIQLGLAYLLLVGYAVRTLFVSLSLPASVGVIISGWLFSYFIQDDIFFGRDMLQELSFFLVLLTAGLGISLPSLKMQHFVVALVPCTLELIAIMTYAMTHLGYTLAEGLNLGTVLVAVGDGLVIPKMKDFHGKFKDHPMPYLMLCWAPLEACYVLALFGVFTSVSAPASRPDINLAIQISWTVLRILATVAGGAFMGYLAGIAINQRDKIKIYENQPLFSKSNPVESFLILLGIALFAYGLGGNSCSILGMGPLFQPELMVIVTGSTFAWYCDTHGSSEVLDQVDMVMGGVWVFGQLVLFTMIGSKTSFSIFPMVTTVFPIMVVGLVVRFVGVMLAVLPMRRETFMAKVNAGGQQGDEGPRAFFTDALFCFLACLPRATIQGALGAVPVNQRFFSDVAAEDRVEAREFIFTAARLYIFCYAIVGMSLLNTIGTWILSGSGTDREHRGSREEKEHGTRVMMQSEGRTELERPEANSSPAGEPKVVRVGEPEVLHPKADKQLNLRPSASNVSFKSDKTSQSYEMDETPVHKDPQGQLSAEEFSPSAEPGDPSTALLAPKPAEHNVSDPGPSRPRIVTEPDRRTRHAMMQSTKSMHQRWESLYGFDQLPPVSTLQTLPERGRRGTAPGAPGAPGAALAATPEGNEDGPRPRRRSLQHGQGEVPSDSDEMFEAELERGTASRGARSHTWDASVPLGSYR